jgi:hypothetical protein
MDGYRLVGGKTQETPETIDKLLNNIPGPHKSWS